jgi:hypothetical protein
LEGIKNVNFFPELRNVHRSIRPARIVCAHLPDRFPKTAQHFRALMSLADLRLVLCETELLADHRRKSSQPNERVEKPNQFARLFRLCGHSLHFMPELASSG